MYAFYCLYGHTASALLSIRPGGPAALRCERRSSLLMLHNGVPMPPVSRTLAFFGSLASTVGTSRRLWAACLLLVLPLASYAADYLYIGGNPVTSLPAGRSYSFRPWVSTPATAGKKLTFSVKSKPYWASFDAN